MKNRRGFLCRIRNKNSNLNEDLTSFSTVHITGFIQSHNEEAYSQHNYFLATIRLFDNVIKDFNYQETMQFSSRHDKIGKIRLIENEYVKKKHKIKNLINYGTIFIKITYSTWI